MTDYIDVLVVDDRWTGLDLPQLAARCRRLVVAELGLAAEIGFSILACDDAKIATLNQAFRDKPVATNVLSWPAETLTPDQPGQAPPPPTSDDLQVGDIAIAYETVAAEAQLGQVSLKEHTTHLLIHGILHLLGYDHETDADAALMEGIEVAALAKLGIANPY